MTKEIVLSRGMVALVDDADYEWANQWNWYACRNTNIFYATREVMPREHRKRLWLHRELMSPPEGMTIDHINGDGLDNRRINMRLALQRENVRNQPLHKDSKSGYKGVSWKSSHKKWVANIDVNHIRYFLGHFDDLIEAALAYDEGAKKYHGEFARLNFPNT